MKFHLPWLIIITLCAAFEIPASATEVISGVPQIVDGDTAWIGKTKIRLEGIDAPETDQLCLDAKSMRWACGVASRDALNEYSAGRSWDCDLSGKKDGHDRALGRCFVEGEDIQAWMVRQGWALSFVRYSHAYDADQIVARSGRAGLWAGAFLAPWEWRGRNKHSVIFGAASVPSNAQIVLLDAWSAEHAPSPECNLKGNISRSGRVYHHPGQLDYAGINMEKPTGKRWFCSDADAEAAGWRKAAR